MISKHVCYSQEIMLLTKFYDFCNNKIQNMLKLNAKFKKFSIELNAKLKKNETYPANSESFVSFCYVC